VGEAKKWAVLKCLAKIKAAANVQRAATGEVLQLRSSCRRLMIADRIDGMLSSVAVSGLDCVTKFDGSRYQTLTNTVSSIILLIKTGKM